MLFVALGCGEASHAQGTGTSPLDMQVRAFLDQHRSAWRDLTVPESDGRLLYDLIRKNRFTRARVNRFFRIRSYRSRPSDSGTVRSRHALRC